MTSQYAQAVVDGVLSGGVYALMVNIAQGVMVVLGAYLSYALSVHPGLDLFATLVVTVPALFVVGVAVEWLFMRRLADRDRTAMSILVTYAVAIIIEGILIQVFGPDFVQLHSPYVDKSVHVLGFYLPYIYIYGFMLAVVLLGLLYALLYLTRFGQALRASLQDRRAAELIGIEVNKVRTLTFGIGVAVTAAGGMVFGATNAFNPNSGYDLISRLLTIVILGGLGSIGGALVAAVFMLVIEDVVAVAWSPTWSTLVFFAVLVIVLTFKPSGLFGRAAVRAQ